MNRYRMYARADRHGTYYWEDVISRRQGSLKTKDRGEAQKLLHAKNETGRQPHLNRELGRVYLKAADPAFATRTWQDVIDSFCARRHLRESSLERPRRAFAGKHFDPIRRIIITETSTELFLGVIEKAGNASTDHYLRRLHNYALGLGWLPWIVVPPLAWPRRAGKKRRAITEDEHLRIVAGESNSERRLYYELLWLTGASQSDGAELRGEQVDWENGILSFPRKKLKPDDPPCVLSIGPRLSALLRQLPQSGALFPKVRSARAKDRSAEFHRRCRLLKIRGVSLHSYRDGWAQRAKKAGMPERYAQVALGHASKSVHRAYARGAVVTVPSLETYEEKARNIVAFPSMPGPENQNGAEDTALLTLLLPGIRQALLSGDKSRWNRILSILASDPAAQCSVAT